MKESYSIGEFAKKTGITVRTLHYYDELELLKPAFISESGRRFYSEDNIIQLQKIITLKFLGYSLERINEIIQSNEWSLQESLKFQKKEMLQKKEQINEVLRALEHALLVVEEQGTIDSNIFISLINSIQYEEEYKDLLKSYLKPEDVYKINIIPEERQQDMNIQLSYLYQQLKNAYNSPVDNEEVQELIAKYLSLAERAYSDLIPNVEDIVDTNITIDENLFAFTSPFTKEEEDWFGKALKVYLENRELEGTKEI